MHSSHRAAPPFTSPAPLPFTNHTEIAASKSSLTLEELQSKFTELQQLADSLDKRLALCRNGPQVSAADVAAADKALAAMVDAWQRRRRMFLNVWEAVSENIDGKQADLFEDIGIDTDEAVGEVLATYQKLLPQSKKVKR